MNSDTDIFGNKVNGLSLNFLGNHRRLTPFGAHIFNLFPNAVELKMNL